MTEKQDSQEINQGPLRIVSQRPDPEAGSAEYTAGSLLGIIRSNPEGYCGVIALALQADNKDHIRLLWSKDLTRIEMAGALMLAAQKLLGGSG